MFAQKVLTTVGWSPRLGKYRDAQNKLAVENAKQNQSAHYWAEPKARGQKRREKRYDYAKIYQSCS